MDKPCTHAALGPVRLQRSMLVLSIGKPSVFVINVCVDFDTVISQYSSHIGRYTERTRGKGHRRSTIPGGFYEVMGLRHKNRFETLSLLCGAPTLVALLLVSLLALSACNGHSATETLLEFPTAPAGKLEITYPLNETLFPLDIVAPTFIWNDQTAQIEQWQILLEKTKSRYVRRQAPYRDFQLVERLAAKHPVDP